jgi:hypothetical protein
MSFLQLEQLDSTWQSELQLGNSFFKSAEFGKAYAHYIDVAAKDFLSILTQLKKP